MRYDNITPTGSFIHNYMSYMQEQETASAYDFWCAMWMLSVACGRDVIVDRPRAPVYLNIYAILVAESGVTRKSSAVRTAFNIVRDFNDEVNVVMLIESKITPEKLDERLHVRYRDTGSSAVAIGISELAVFMGIEKSQSAMPALLTDIYDCPTSRSGGGTISRGEVSQRNVWCGFLSASTPSWLRRSVNPNIVAGGFTSRCLFITSEKPKRRIAWPISSESNDSARIDNITRLKHIRSTAKSYGRISINEAALKQFSAWYARRHLHIDEFRSSFESREDAHVLRCAALLCINDNTWIIQKQHIVNAIKIIEHCKEEASVLFEGTDTRSNWIMGIVALRERLLKAGTDPIPRSQLFLSCRHYLKSAEYAALLDVMHEMGSIQRFEKRQESKGRPTELIRGTDKLMMKNFVEKLTEAAT